MGTRREADGAPTSVASPLGAREREYERRKQPSLRGRGPQLGLCGAWPSPASRRSARLAQRRDQTPKPWIGDGPGWPQARIVDGSRTRLVSVSSLTSPTLKATPSGPTAHWSPNLFTSSAIGVPTRTEPSAATCDTTASWEIVASSASWVRRSVSTVKSSPIPNAEFPGSRTGHPFISRPSASNANADTSSASGSNPGRVPRITDDSDRTVIDRERVSTSSRILDLDGPSRQGPPFLSSSSKTAGPSRTGIET